MDRLSSLQESKTMELIRNVLSGQVKKVSGVSVPRDLCDLEFNNSGCFISIYKNGKQRGCMGFCLENSDFVKVVMRAALFAGFYDDRFSPLTEDELDEIDISCWFIEEYHKFIGPESINLGEHGVAIQQDGMSAVYLPYAPIMYGWNRERYLNELADKADLPRNTWKNNLNSVKLFTTYKIEEQSCK